MSVPTINVTLGTDLPKSIEDLGKQLMGFLITILGLIVTAKIADLVAMFQQNGKVIAEQQRRRAVMEKQLEEQSNYNAWKKMSTPKSGSGSAASQ